MNVRELPQEEWGKLDGSDIGTAIPYHNPEDIRVIVVEDGDRIVGQWAVLTVPQLEGVWIHPDYRKRGRVAALLLEKTFDVAREQAPYMAFTGSQSQEISSLLTRHLGALKLEQETYIVPLSESLPCR